jgi:rhomboid protease GluP
MSGNDPGSIICPDCRKLINADEKRCPYCNAWNPRMLSRDTALGRIFGDRIDMIMSITVACVVLYLFSLALDPRAAFGDRPGFLSILSPSGTALMRLGMTNAVAPWWTVFTSIYLHGSLLHIFFNLMWIRQLGPQVEEAFGPARFFVIFSVSGAAGFVLSNTISGAPTIGASGSVFGLLAALIVYGRRVGGHFGEMITRQLWQWAVLLFVLGFIMRGVNNWAHAGGFIAGWIVTTLIGRTDGHDTRPVQLVALVLMGITLYGFGVAAVWIARVLVG